MIDKVDTLVPSPSQRTREQLQTRLRYAPSPATILQSRWNITPSSRQELRDRVDTLVHTISTVIPEDTEE